MSWEVTKKQQTIASQRFTLSYTTAPSNF